MRRAKRLRAWTHTGQQKAGEADCSRRPSPSLPTLVWQMPHVSITASVQRAASRAPLALSRFRTKPAAAPPQHRRGVAAMAGKDPLCGDVFFLDEVR